MDIQTGQTPSRAKTIYEHLGRTPERQFWTLQAVGWLALCVVTFFTLTLWYNTLELIYIAHTLLQAVLGIAVSLPMRWAFKRAWNMPLALRLALVAAVVVLASMAWTALRLQTFIWIVHETDVWTDFGGWYFGSFMVLSSWTLAYHAIKHHRLLLAEKERAVQARADANEERVKRLLAEGLSREAQLKMLRYQLNPHFLFNTLNSISALIKTARNDEAREMVTRLAQFLRHTLDSDPALKVTLDQELETVSLYLDIERKRFGERLTVDFDIGPGTADALVPAFVLQPLFENALKFAVGRSARPETITMASRREGASLVLTVSDTGPGVEPGTDFAELSERGVGLRNIRQRLETEYGEAHGFDIAAAEPGGFKVRITLPLEREAAPAQAGAAAE